MFTNQTLHFMLILLFLLAILVFAGQSVQEATTTGNLYAVVGSVYFNESIPYQITALRATLFVGSNNGIYALQNDKIISTFGKNLDVPAGVCIRGEDLLVADSKGVYKFRNIIKQLDLKLFSHQQLMTFEKVHFPRTIKSSGDDILVTHEKNGTRIVVSFQENEIGYCVQSKANAFGFGRSRDSLYSISNNSTSCDSYLSYFDKGCTTDTDRHKSSLGCLEIVSMSYTDYPMYMSGGSKATYAVVITASQKLGKIVTVNPLFKTHFELVEATNSSMPLVPWDVWTDNSGFWFSEHRYKAIFHVSLTHDYVLPFVVLLVGFLVAVLLFGIIFCLCKDQKAYKELLGSVM